MTFLFLMSCVVPFLRHFNTTEYWPVWIGFLWFALSLVVRLTTDIGPKDLGQWENDWAISLQFQDPVFVFTLTVFFVGTIVSMKLVHTALGIQMLYAEYWLIMILLMCAKVLGTYVPLRTIGLGTSFWCIILGCFTRTCFRDLQKYLRLIMSMEFFIKTAIVLFAINIQEIVTIGPKGIVVGWIETTLLLLIVYSIGIYVLRMRKEPALLIASGLAICGSSAIMSIADIIYAPTQNEHAPTQNEHVQAQNEHVQTQDEHVQAQNEHVQAQNEHVQAQNEHVHRSEHDLYRSDQIKNDILVAITVVSVFTIPYIPVMPILCKQFFFSDRVCGTWIGGTIDSTGAVVASAGLVNQTALNTAVILKMLQNILIGPITLMITSIWFKTTNPKILLDRFPKFVLGFLLVSSIVSGLPSKREVVARDLFIISEWFSNISFVLVGMDIDLRDIPVLVWYNFRSLSLYIIGQTIDTFTTLGVSIWMFG